MKWLNYGFGNLEKNVLIDVGKIDYLTMMKFEFNLNQYLGL